MKKIMFILLLALSFVLINNNYLYAQDVSKELTVDSTYHVITFNGKEYKGKLISANENEIVLNSNEIGDITIPKYEIQKITKINLSDKISLGDDEYFIKTFSGGEFKGKIIKDDSKEVTIVTEDRGKMTIPKYEIDEISKVSEYVSKTDKLASIYVFNKSAISIPKGESYISFNFFGPDFNYGISDNFDIGLTTSWVAQPILLTFKGTINLSDNAKLALGSSVGFLSWTDFDEMLLAPFATLTFGSSRKNISFSGGMLFGESFDLDISGSNPLFKVCGVRSMSDKWDFVFDSFVAPITDTDATVGFIIPSFRIYSRSNNAFQFGFGAIFSSETSGALPYPSIQWIWNI